ncbi:MAG: 50S ribosomal protein L9 [Candidatus Omnitrophica bacterium]|nr:50S ribosomal protein L9 [Candidatus Omnitrophota bacterium]
MDVILLQDVETLGKEGAILHVKPGFARNYLLPRGLALPASEENQRALEARTRRAHAKAARVRKQAEALKQRLEAHSLTLTLALGEGDKPFGSVTPHEIVEALAKDGITVEKHSLQLEQPIKALGIYEIPVRLHPEVAATLKLWVTKA